MVTPSGTKTIVFHAVIAARRTERGACDVDVESKIQWLGSLKSVGAEVSLANMNRVVAGTSQQAWQRDVT